MLLILRVVFPRHRKQTYRYQKGRRGREKLGLKLKLQYFGHLMRKVDSLEKILILGGIGGRRRR